ncbi:MAG: hypothetical protein LLF98_11935 [Clostridium sp.]|uniref:hypothetical protein n=1 Tax=Clostridium sp. TaxID=1506 RepID=UPI0025BD284C|nr:hypothetical protein [Clostridium sp.]MCE5221939.1 hypothetical protein [Clostridium sp.]
MIRDSLTVLLLLTVILGVIFLLYATGILRRKIVITTIENLPLGIFKENNVQVQEETVKTSIQENSKSDENKLIECTNIPDEEIVYWTPQGQHYHKMQNCRTLLRSKVINCGSINESGKLTECHKCN